MSFSVCLAGRLLLLGCALVLTGCWPGGHSQLDEEKEPHFLVGKSRVNEMDYPGAIEAFEKALEVNPRSGSAHFEVGLLYEKNKVNYAAAIYHFERFLELRPKSDYAEVVKQRILACKQELARTVSLGPVTQGLQNEFEKMTEENKRLTEENKRLRDDVEKWRAYYSRPAATNPAAHPVVPARLAVVGSAALTASAASVAMPGKTHTIKPGETPGAIARQYGVKVDALMAANPRLDARRLQVGATMRVPTP
jgi:LysM repeat protein